MISIDHARAEFGADPGFLNTASVGIPPRAGIAALTQALATWSAGRAAPQDYDAVIDDARASFARLLKVPVDAVAQGSQLSVFAGLVAANLPDGAEVVAARNDFTWVLFPFLTQRRGVQVHLVPLAEVAQAVRPSTSLVSVSAVQSADGALADLANVASAAAAHGAQTFLDVTQAAGWLPIDAARFDYVVCSAYKWLLCPRGVAFMAIRPERVDALVPHNANWYAGDDRWESIYGGPISLASNARRFDVSPAWLAWVGAAPALALLEQVGIQAIHAHDVALANRFLAGLGEPAGDSAIVTVIVPDAEERLRRAGVRTAVRAGRVRLSFHLYNDDADVDHALNALTDR